MILLETEKTLRPEDSRTNLVFGFDVPEGCARLCFDFSYSPKELADEALSKELIERALKKYAPEPYAAGYGGWRDYLPLVNLLTLSLDAPEGYRGCAHRHPPVQHHELTGDSASDGFTVGPLTPGAWRAVVNCHAVVTPECTVRLRVACAAGGEEA